MKKVLITVAAVLMLCAGTVFAGGPDMQAGKWEVTLTMEMEGFAMPMPPTKYTKCVTPADIQNNTGITPSADAKGDSCKVTDMKLVGNKATWNMNCKDGSTGTGEITYKKTTYEGTMSIKTSGGKKMKYKFNGKRIGDC